MPDKTNLSKVTNLDDFVPGMTVQWEWVPKGFGQSAIDKGIRPMGLVVDRSVLPNMACEIGIRVIDDPYWVIDPEFAMGKGRVFYKMSDPALG